MEGNIWQCKSCGSKVTRVAQRGVVCETCSIFMDIVGVDNGSGIRIRSRRESENRDADGGVRQQLVDGDQHGSSGHAEPRVKRTGKDVHEV